MLGDNTGRQLDGWKTSGHNLRDDIIRVVLRLPKTEALNWLSKGTAHRAILARDIADFPEATDLRKVWIAPGCPVLDGNPVQISQSLHLYLADCKFPWAIVRTPYRWGVRTHKDNEREIKSIVQPNSVFVPEGHVKFRIDNVPKTLDSAVLVASEYIYMNIFIYAHIFFSSALNPS